MEKPGSGRKGKKRTKTVKNGKISIKRQKVVDRRGKACYTDNILKAYT